MSQNCDVIVIFPIYGQFGAIRSRIANAVCKTYVLIDSNLLSYKAWKQLKNIYHSPHTIALSKDTIFGKNQWFFAKKKMLTSTKLRGLSY